MIANKCVIITGKHIDAWKSLTEAVTKKKKRRRNADSDDSDDDWANLSGRVMDKAMKKRCPMDIVGPKTYHLIENLNDQALNAVLMVNANRSYANNVGCTELSKRMFHANTASGMVLNALTIILGRRDKTQREISDQFIILQKMIAAEDEDMKALSIQTRIIDLNKTVLEFMDEPIDLVNAILKILTFSSAHYFQDRIENMTRKAVKDKFTEKIPVLVEDANLMELMGPERVSFVLGQSSVIASKAKKESAKL